MILEKRIEAGFGARPNLEGRMLLLLNAADRKTRKEFLRIIGQTKAVVTLEKLALLFEQGNFPGALALLDDMGDAFADAVNQAYLTAGQSTAAVIAAQANRPLIRFNSSNNRAVARMSITRGRLIQAMRENEQARLAHILGSGLQEGLRMDEIARTFRDGLGLTPHQQKSVLNFRRMLETGDRQALSRTLRDRRFDPTLNRLLGADGEGLSQAQIDRMVERYEQRFIAHRSNVISRTESVRAVHEGDEDMWQQAVDNGTVRAEDITTRWITSADERVRGSHAAMNGQLAAFGQPFTSGNGNQLRFPGDSMAPASDTINCRCVLDRTIPQAG